MQPSSFMPWLLLLAVPAQTAFAQGNGGPDFKVELDPESCAFSGGSDGAGNVDVSANTGNKKIQVKLTGDGDYVVADVLFSGEGADQMSSSGGGQSKVVNISNRNDGPADVKYSVIVAHKTSGETRDCDPRIINR